MIGINDLATLVFRIGESVKHDSDPTVVSLLFYHLSAGKFALRYNKPINRTCEKLYLQNKVDTLTWNMKVEHPKLLE